jgi:hypothetical protein
VPVLGADLAHECSQLHHSTTCAPKLQHQGISASPTRAAISARRTATATFYVLLHSQKLRHRMATITASLQLKHVLTPLKARQASRKTCRSARSAPIRAFQGTERGASGLDVKGLRPTSPAAWAIMRDTLRSRKVAFLQADTAC